jgi:group I intron endonuclease
MRGVYAIVNSATGKAYIGSAVDISRRWAQHRRELQRGTHNNGHLSAAWAKYGEEAFTFQVIEEVPDSLSLVEAEQAWLDRMRTYERDRGYNLSPTAYSILGYKFTPEQCETVRQGMLGKPKTTEHRARLWVNREVTDTFRRQMAENGRAGAGVPKSAAHRQRIGTAQRGSANHGAKLSEAQVVEILRRLNCGERGRHLAAEFGIHESIVSEIKHGRRWCHVQANQR